MKFSRRYMLLVALACLSVTAPVVQGMKRALPDGADQQGDAKKAKPEQGTKNLFDGLPTDLQLLVTDFVVDPAKLMAHWERDKDGNVVAMIGDQQASTVHSSVSHAIPAKIAAINDDATAGDLYKLLFAAIEDKTMREHVLAALGLEYASELNGKDFIDYTFATNDPEINLEIIRPLIEKKPWCLFQNYKGQNLLEFVIAEQQGAALNLLLPHYDLFFKEAENVQKIFMIAIVTVGDAGVIALLDALKQHYELGDWCFGPLICVSLCNKSPSSLAIASTYGASFKKAYKCLDSSWSPLHMCIEAIAQEFLDIPTALKCIKILLDNSADRHAECSVFLGKGSKKGCYSISPIEFAQKALKVNQLEKILEFLKYYQPESKK